MYRFVLLLAAVLVLSACATPQPHATRDAYLRKPASPIRAFEKVGHPVRPAAGWTGQPRNLSTIIQRLQDARRAYRAERQFEAARTRHRQAACRASEQGREVPIMVGGMKVATYCQKSPGDAPDRAGAEINNE